MSTHRFFALMICPLQFFAPHFITSVLQSQPVICMYKYRIFSSAKLKYGPRKIKRRCVAYKFTMKTFFIFCFVRFLFDPRALSLPSLYLCRLKPRKCKTQN